VSGERVLLTGAAGKVGRYVAPQLLQRGYRVYATDVAELPRPANSGESISYIQCDLTQADAVLALVAEAKPDIILHTAAVVAPISYTCSELACKVNLDATCYLVKAAEELADAPHFVFCSTYTVHGPCAPGQAPWDGGAPYAPIDDYAHQKVAAEQRVQDYAGSWSILRIGGVFDAEVLVPAHRNFKAFAFMVPLDQREHGVDVQDVVTALVNSVGARPDKRMLMIGGDASWQKTAREIRTDLFSAMGLRAPRPEAYRDPGLRDHNSGWYCENWMDTRESQALLQFQNHSYSGFIERVRKKTRLLRWLAPLIRPLVERKLYAGSPYLGDDAISSGPTLWQDIKTVYGATDAALQVNETLPELKETA
jgi:nucleoside-diphosphate-sugar epimerase